MRKILLVPFLIAAAFPLFAASLTPTTPVELTGTHGKFDFIKIDESRGRLLACHTGNGSLDVIDEATSKLIKSIPTGAAQGVAIDDKNGRYFVSVSKPPQLVIIDATRLEATGTVALPGPADVCTYSAALNRVVVDDDEKPEQWWVDPDAKKIVKSFTYQGSGMEDLAFSVDGAFFIQNIKDTSKVMVVDLANDPAFAQDGVLDNSSTLYVSTLAAEKPHGLAMVGDDKVLIAGGNGKLVLLNYKTGKVIASADIAPRVDEIAYDPGSGDAYCASGTGVISVANVGKDSFGPSEAVTSAQGAHSIAVDAKNHVVWIVFAKDDKTYVQRFPERIF